MARDGRGAEAFGSLLGKLYVAALLTDLSEAC